MHEHEQKEYKLGFYLPSKKQDHTLDMILTCLVTHLFDRRLFQHEFKILRIYAPYCRAYIFSWPNRFLAPSSGCLSQKYFPRKHVFSYSIHISDKIGRSGFHLLRVLSKHAELHFGKCAAEIYVAI